ncbi:MAG: recombinase family protein [Firmicutes bacterium]|nr:recombinase family protein [Bacillota bacterium]
MKEIKRVALYIRVSTEHQVKEGDSLEAQENALLEYCNKYNYIVVDKYIDGGESGQKIKRTNLQRMLDDVKQDKIDLILMTKLDRWFRNIGDFYKVIEIIKKHKTDWKTIWEDYDTTTASGEFWLNMSLSMGQLEAKRTSERINSVFDYKYNVQKTVCTGQPPYGYKISEDKKLVIDEKEAQNIVKLFEYYAKTNNLNETANWFKENCENKSTCVIKKYLRNPAYIGKFVRTKTKETIDDYCPAIISEELWNNVQRLIKINVKKQIPDPNRKKHNSEPYIFSGLLICKECGHTLNGKTNSNSKHYYNCRYHYFKKCDNKKCINERWLEQHLLNEIIPILKNRKLQIVNINDNQQEIVDNSQQLKTKLKKLTNLYLENMVDLDYYKEEYLLINSQLEKIKCQKDNQNKLDYSYIDNFLNSNFLDIYSNLDNLEKRRLWSSIIDNVEILDYDNIKINVY